ncbi:MAG: hypothetical protein A2017_19930 [Lentisphaerae bacterium GWF2_44_16]|nr:MAG: hypothetical protein A2017_19930 [Lentisphaerae bacterium GWF2_44_16]
MIKKISCIVVVLTASTLILPAFAGLSPFSQAMIAVRAAKAVKKHKEKAEDEAAEKQKLEKLRERYPKDVQEYEAALKNDPNAAKRKLASMVTQYQKDTGEDLDKTYAVKKQEGLVRKMREKLSGESENSSDGSTNSETSGEKRGGILSRLRGD